MKKIIIAIVALISLGSAYSDLDSPITIEGKRGNFDENYVELTQQSGARMKLPRSSFNEEELGKDTELIKAVVLLRDIQILPRIIP